MLDLSNILVGLAGLAALALVLLAHDWRDEYLERRAMRGPMNAQAAHHHPLHDWWLRPQASALSEALADAANASGCRAACAFLLAGELRFALRDLEQIGLQIQPMHGL